MESVRPDGHRPVYAQGSCSCGYKPTYLPMDASPDAWDTAIDRHIARFVTSWRQT